MNKLPLESNLSFQQKFHISIFIALGLITVFRLLMFSLNTSRFFILLGALLITLFLIVAFLSKKGFAEKNGRIFNAIYLYDLIVYKQQIDFTDAEACSVLKFRKNQKYSFFTAARPDLAYDFNAFDIYLLNKRHTVKKRLISLKEETNSKKAIDFLTEHTRLRNEIYSPNFG